MRPRESGGNVPKVKITPKAKVVVKPIRPEVSVQRKSAPTSAKAPPAPASYYHMPQRSPLSYVTRETRKKPEDSLTPAQIRTAKRYQVVDRNFPYAHPLQVAYANASGDIERNILPKAVEVPTKPPEVHPGLQRGVAGYAYRGKNDIYLTPTGYSGDPRLTRDVALHELAHTRQPSTRLPKWVIEGGADYVAKRNAKKLGIPYRPGYPKYLKSVERRVRKQGQ